MKWWWSWVPVQLLEHRVPDPGLPGQDRTWEGDVLLGWPCSRLTKAKRQHYPLFSTAQLLALLRSVCTSRLPGQSVFLLREGMVPWRPWSPGLPTGLVVPFGSSSLDLGSGQCVRCLYSCFMWQFFRQGVLPSRARDYHFLFLL